MLSGRVVLEAGLGAVVVRWEIGDSFEREYGYRTLGHSAVC